MNNTLNVNEENIYMACLYYYYSSLIIDREDLMFRIIDVKNTINRINIKYIKTNLDVDMCWNLITFIVSSNHESASNIRKLVFLPNMSNNIN